MDFIYINNEFNNKVLKFFEYNKKYNILFSCCDCYTVEIFIKHHTDIIRNIYNTFEVLELSKNLNINVIDMYENFKYVYIDKSFIFGKPSKNNPLKFVSETNKFLWLDYYNNNCCLFKENIRDYAYPTGVFK